MDLNGHIIANSVIKDKWWILHDAKIFGQCKISSDANLLELIWKCVEWVLMNLKILE